MSCYVVVCLFPGTWIGFSLGCQKGQGWIALFCTFTAMVATKRKLPEGSKNTISNHQNHIKSLFSFQCELINSNPRHSEALVVVQQHLFGGIPLQLLQSCGTNSNGGVKTCQNYVAEDKRELEMVF